MQPRTERTRWVSYLRVSTADQVERELSLPAQQRATSDFATRHGATIEHEYVEAGASGTDPHRPVLQQLLGDALRPGSAISTIVVHHTSRFTRDATHARVVKSKLRKAGVRVLSVSQDFADDATGKLIEGFFECFDQYESELNGLRTSAAMRESVRQGFYPGAHAPYGFRTEPVEFHPGVLRHRLVIEPREAAVLRQAYRLDISSAGAKSVARELNRLGHRTRSGALWTKGLVGNLLEHEAAVGTVWWGRRQGNRLRPKEEWLALKVEPIIDDKTYALAQQLRRQREPRRAPGRAAAKPHLLSGLLRCGICGSSYQLETSGKKVDGAVYRYCYYNCRAACRTGVEACAGFRVSTEVLDGAVLSAIADVVCTEERVRHLAQSRGWPAERVLPAWRALITADCDIGRGYALHLIERIDVFGERLVVTPKDGGRIAKAPEIGLLTDL